MKTHRSYSDHDIASYVLGLDLPDYAVDIQARLAHDDAAAARALKWEAYFLGIADALPPSPPPAALLAQIQATLGMEDAPIRGESRQAQDPHARSGDDAAAAGKPVARARPRRLSKRRVALAVGIILVVLAAVVLIWASLKPLPASTTVQQPLHLEPK